MNLVKFTIVLGFVLVLTGSSIAFGQTGNPTTKTAPKESGWVAMNQIDVPASNAPQGISEVGVTQVKDGRVATAEETAKRLGVDNYTPVGKTQPHGAPAPVYVSAGSTVAPQPQVVYVNQPADRVATTRSSNVNAFIETSGFANGNSPDANRTGLELVQLNNEAVREDHNHVENMTNIAVENQRYQTEASGRTLSTIFNFVNDQKMIKNEEKRRQVYQKEEQREQNRRTLNDLSDEAQEWVVLRNRQK